MTTRTTRTTVTFREPFVLAGYQQRLPAGDYVVEAEEELLEGLSFAAYRRVSTMLHVHAVPGHPGRSEVWPIDPEDLDHASRDSEGRADAP